MDVVLVDTAHAGPPAEDTALIVAGGPTHTFSMTRPATRVNAARQGASQATPDRGLREWLTDLPSRTPTTPGPAVVTFDTRINAVRHLPGSAARSAATLLRRKGYRLCGSPTSFYVSDVEGPLRPGEEDRATRWGRAVAGLAPTGAGHA